MPCLHLSDSTVRVVLDRYSAARAAGDDLAADRAIRELAAVLAPRQPDYAAAWWLADRIARTYRIAPRRALVELERVVRGRTDAAAARP